MVRSEIAENLRTWIGDKSRRDPKTIEDNINLIEENILSSLDILEFIMFIESIGGKTGNLRAGVFKSINTVIEAFFPLKHYD